MAKVCVIAILFLIDRKCHYCLFKKFPNLVVYRANFPNLKGPTAPSQNCQKIPVRDLSLFTVLPIRDHSLMVAHQGS